MDFSAYLDASLGRIAELIGRSDVDPSQLATLLGHRTLFLLREASKDQLLQEAMALDKALAAPAGPALRERSPEAFGAAQELADLLGEAIRRRDRAAVPSILSSRQGHGRKVLERLASAGQPVLRSEFRGQLGLSESHLSHLLRELEEADLIRRSRTQGREVVVELGPVGREVVESSVLPAWVAHLAETIASANTQAALPTASALEQDLVDLGAPRLAAQRLAAACGAADAVLSEEARKNLDALLQSVTTDIQVQQTEGPRVLRLVRRKVA